MPRESEIYQAIMSYLKKTYGHEWYGFKSHGNQFQRGQPDIIGVLGGRAFVCETKQPGEKPTPLQAAVLAKWREAGAIAFWADSLDVVKGYLNGTVPQAN